MLTGAAADLATFTYQAFGNLRNTTGSTQAEFTYAASRLMKPAGLSAGQVL